MDSIIVLRRYSDRLCLLACEGGEREAKMMSRAMSWSTVQILFVTNYWDRDQKIWWRILMPSFLVKQGGLLWWLSGKESSCGAGDAEDMGLILELGRSPGKENHNPLQYSCLGNPTNRGAWWARVHGAAESWTQLSTAQQWFTRASFVAQMVKNPPAIRRPGFDPWVWKIPWRREWLPTPVFLPGEFHRQRSLAGGCKESDRTERLTLSLS